MTATAGIDWAAFMKNWQAIRAPQPDNADYRYKRHTFTAKPTNVISPTINEGYRYGANDMSDPAYRAKVARQQAQDNLARIQSDRPMDQWKGSTVSKFQDHANTQGYAQYQADQKAYQNRLNAAQSKMAEINSQTYNQTPTTGYRYGRGTQNAPAAQFARRNSNPQSAAQQGLAALEQVRAGATRNSALPPAANKGASWK